MHLQIERDNMLTIQSNVPTVLFFMGLQHKQGVPIHEGQKFDICGTMDEFRQSVGMYMFWKPLMDVYFSHVSQTRLGRHKAPLERDYSPKSCNMLCLVNNGYSICYV